MIADTRIKERPILFSGPMVRAILDGRKTQTRRVVSPRNSTVLGQPGASLWKHLHWDAEKPCPAWVDRGFPDDDGAYRYQHLHVPAWNPADGDVPPEGPDKMYRVRCLWEPSERLWVREAFYADVREPMDSVNPAIIYAATPEWAKEKAKANPTRCTFLDHKPVSRHDAAANLSHHRFQRLRPSIHMPRWASRITLEIVGVRVERVQEITEDDAVAEGMHRFSLGEHGDVFGFDPKGTPGLMIGGTATEAFAMLWDSINGKRPGCSWASNPWVWAITFRRIEGGGR